MSSEAASTGPPETSTAEEDQAIRERVRSLMSQLLRQGQIDPEGVKEVMRAVTGGRMSGTPLRRTRRKWNLPMRCAGWMLRSSSLPKQPIVPWKPLQFGARMSQTMT